MRKGNAWMSCAEIREDVFQQLTQQSDAKQKCYARQHTQKSRGERRGLQRLLDSEWCGRTSNPIS